MTNFIFSRRAMQKCITDLNEVLEPTQLSSLVKRLNTIGSDRLPAMWELMVLYGLSKVGDLSHEQMLPNGRRPDINWKIPTLEKNFISIIGDITTISDSGLDELNPYKQFTHEVSRIASKFGLKPICFWCDVRGQIIGSSHKSKMRLMLPKKSEMNDFIKNKIEPWIYSLKANPHEKSIFDYKENNHSIKITYSPSHTSSGGGSYTSYKVATSKITNPLFNALKAKVKQLKREQDTAFRLIVACDGGCELLRNGDSWKSHYTHNSREIVAEFLRQHSSIDMVLLVATTELRHGFLNLHDYQIDYELHYQPSELLSKHHITDTINLINNALKDSFSYLPKPLRPAYRSAVILEESQVGCDNLGRYTIQGNMIEISSRGFFRLLSGQITLNEFLEAHEWDKHGFPHNLFETHFKGKLMIRKIELISGGDTDDDNIRFIIDKFDEKPDLGINSQGKYPVKNNQITISSRGLIRFLSREITFQDFIQAHGWNKNPFANHIASKLMIRKIEVIHDEETYDDKITFTIDKFDVANADFVTSA